MSVFPQFVQHIHDVGIYVEGYNYEAMYNIMVNNLTNNFIPTQQFIYTYAQVEDLYNLLDELINSNISEVETNDVEIIESNENMNQSDIDDWTDEETEPEPENVNIINIIDPNQNIQYYYNIQYEPHTQPQAEQIIYYLNNMNLYLPNNINNNNLN